MLLQFVLQLTEMEHKQAHQFSQNQNQAFSDQDITALDHQSSPKSSAPSDNLNQSVPVDHLPEEVKVDKKWQQDDSHPAMGSSQEKTDLQHRVDEIIQKELPIHMIQFDTQTKNYIVSPEAIEFLQRIKERIGVICVAGKYRTGKSFLLNRVIINTRDKKGFGVGPTINPCTKGLWCWTQLLETTFQDKPLKVLLIDSEGIGALDEDENHDTKIFLLALLLSSYFIYNSIGTIDENALNNLQLIINLSKELQIKSEMLEESDPEDFSKYFPSFLWVVRDFSLRLLNLDGDPITSREYLEQSLSLQKGFTESVEHKNRIRRLITQVFPDRDCFTLVRPVEQEKQLQSLQQMPDEQLRPEFLKQMRNLRAKIFKKVKPKQLNGKLMSGEMLLELAQAYTGAINEGTVPNIQNAWSYVCQNECNRAIQESIQTYQNEMRPAVNQAKESLDQGILKKAHSNIRNRCVLQFQQKALGTDVTEYEQMLRDGISKANQKIKAEFLKFCHQKARDWLDPEFQVIRKKLHEGAYKAMDTVQEEIDLIKQKFLEHGPKFQTAGMIFTDMSGQIICKAATYLTISCRQEVNIHQSKLQERVEYLEERAMQDKKEFESTKSRLEKTISDLENDRAEALKNEKVSQERLRLAKEEHQKHLSKLQNKTGSQVEELQDEIKTLKSVLNEQDRTHKRKDEDWSKSNTELGKLNALLEQKLELIEKELKEYKAKYSSKDADCKEINKELNKTRKELTHVSNQMHQLDTAHAKELQKMRSQYDQKVKQMEQEYGSAQSRVSIGADVTAVDIDSKYKMLSEQMSMMMSTFQRMSTVGAPNPFSQNPSPDAPSTKSAVSQDDLNKQKEKIESLKQSNKDLHQINANLSSQVVQMQDKQQNLEKTLSTYKKYKWMLHHAAGIQCLQCSQFFTRELFSNHLPQCRSQIMRISTIHANSIILPIKIQLQESAEFEVVEMGSEKSNVLQQFSYKIQVDNRGDIHTLDRSLFQIVQFFQQVEMSFKGGVDQQLIEYIEVNKEKLKDVIEGELKQMIQDVMENLQRIPFISNSQIFLDFFNITQSLSASIDKTPTSPFSQSMLVSSAQLEHAIDDNSPRQSMILNNYMNLQNKIIHQRVNSSASRQSLLVLPGSFQQSNEDFTKISNFKSIQQTPIEGRRKSKTSLLDMPRPAEELSFANMKHVGIEPDGRLSTINQQSELGSEDYVSTLNRASDISALTGFTSVHPQGQTQQPLQVKKSPFTMINETSDATRKSGRYAMQEQDEAERHSTADFGDMSSHTQSDLIMARNPFGSQSKISEIDEVTMQSIKIQDKALNRETIGGNHSNQFEEEEGDSMQKPPDQNASLFPKTPAISQSVTIKNERYADISADILDDDEDVEALVDDLEDDVDIDM